MVGDAEELPFDDGQFDIYTIAFGIRNVTHIEQVSDWVMTGLGGNREVPMPTVLTACVSMFVVLPPKAAH